MAASPVSDPAPAFELAGVAVDAPGKPSGDRPRMLRDVDWRVRAGEHWAVIGANGAGKTTLLRTVSGALVPSAGTVTVLGERPGAPGLRDPRLRTAVIGVTPAVVPQSLTATEVVVLR